MAHNEIDVDAAPEAVFGVLADPRSYARWVVGSRAIRRADRGWPNPGTAFDHTVGIGPLRLKDHSEAVECEPPRLLRLRVKARPLTVAWVTLRMTQLDRKRTRITMDEHPADMRSRIFLNPLSDPLVRLRNRESLRRLKALAERREPIPTGTLPARESDAEAFVEASSRPAPPAG
ncbi:SRPBCC family protein [Conexibacter sp. CPCC 206217]|uniref:SRPBCC family protein n=1 Tax=Conexibacter sp. CPCC 206217 TaxID=3064574 RepID=UPI002720E165|nr:SRPBCC family protein [Conexibacter sp. CPCC 206217]MDO8212186.1 SRPBCC family protein [Conexibacter sp. CPCC 206217]